MLLAIFRPLSVCVVDCVWSLVYAGVWVCVSLAALCLSSGAQRLGDHGGGTQRDKSLQRRREAWPGLSSPATRAGHVDNATMNVI